MSDTLTTLQDNDGAASTTPHVEELRRKYTVAKAAVADLAGEATIPAALRLRPQSLPPLPDYAEPE